jgi:hypothetical protein
VWACVRDSLALFIYIQGTSGVVDELLSPSFCLPAALSVFLAEEQHSLAKQSLQVMGMQISNDAMIVASTPYSILLSSVPGGIRLPVEFIMSISNP